MIFVVDVTTVVSVVAAAVAAIQFSVWTEKSQKETIFLVLTELQFITFQLGPPSLNPHFFHLNVCFYKKWANLGLFFGLFLSFSHHNFNNTNQKNIDDVFGI